jgi:outer membrane protein TolC
MNPSTPGSGKDPVMVSVGINLPIWLGKNKARKNEAVARYREAQYNLQETRNRLTSFTNETIYAYDDARRKVSLYRDGLVPKAEQSLNVSFAAYQSGEIDFLNLLDAQRQLLDFQLTLDRARTNAATRQAELEVITGHDFKDFSSDSTSEEK